MYIFPRTSLIATALLLSSNIMGESDLEDSATHPFEHITAASNIVIQVCQYNFGTHFHDKPLMNHPFPQLHYFNLILSLPSSRWCGFLNNQKKKKNTNITKEWTTWTRARSLTRRCWSFFFFKVLHKRHDQDIVNLKVLKTFNTWISTRKSLMENSRYM